VADVAELAHSLEDLLDRLRMGRIAVSKALVDLLFDSVDALNRLVIAVHDPAVRELVDIAALNRRAGSIAHAEPRQQSDDLLAQIALEAQTRKSLTEYEEHRLTENLRAGRAIVSVEASFDFADFDEKLRAMTETLSKTGEVLSTLPSPDPGGGIGFRLLVGSDLSAEAVAATVPGARVTPLGRVEAAQREPEEEISLKSLSPTVRVDIAKLDAVMNTIGELAIERAQLDALARTLAGRQGHQLAKISRNLDRKLTELQKSALDLRMVPVGQIYNRLSRNVRKLARELNKDVDLVLRGEETELDKMIVEEITDPLMHIVRNALDHGIEPPGERTAAGKRASGALSITAYQQGSSVVLDVTDDGRGIDPGRIRETAVRRGLIAAAETVDDERAFELLFTPGFSTAAEVSEISGRGVGLDVVKKNIQDLNGRIEVLSEVGKQTTFRITLPITLAIIQALIVRSGAQRFAVPLPSVEESLRILAEEVATVEGREVLAVRDLVLPLVRLADVFLAGAANDRATESPDTKLFVVVTRSGERVAGIVVDAIVRQQEIVIKSIGARLRDTPGIAGATEIGEGEIVLVIDVASLIEHFGGRARAIRVGV